MTCSAPRCLAAAALVAAGLWTITGLAFAATVAIGPLRVHAHGLLAGLGLHPVPHDPTTGALARRLATNLRVAALPVLLAAIGAARHRVTRLLADTIVAATLAANAALVGAALAVDGRRLLGYLPHLPLEWAALACATAPWLTARRRPLDTGDWRPAVAAALALLVAAGVVETYLTPRPG